LILGPAPRQVARRCGLAGLRGRCSARKRCRRRRWADRTRTPAARRSKRRTTRRRAGWIRRGLRLQAIPRTCARSRSLWGDDGGGSSDDFISNLPLVAGW